jgi:hypothetical protein
MRATIDRTGGWFAEQEWQGVRLHRLLHDVGDARSVLVISHTGYARRLPLGDLDRLLLATHAGDTPCRSVTASLPASSPQAAGAFGGSNGLVKSAPIPHHGGGSRPSRSPSRRSSTGVWRDSF